MTTSAASSRRRRGSLEELPSGALRASVYAGTDPVTGRRHYLREVIPAGPAARSEADKVLRRLANQVDERRNPRTNATLDQLLDRHFDMLGLEPNTVVAYRELAANHIRPLIGTQKVGSLGGDVFDSFYAELRRCRHRCSGHAAVEHRTSRSHDCDTRCKPHVCRPLSAATTRKIHFILSGALKRAVRWRWIAINPIAQAEPPPQPKPNPQPPAAEAAARLLGEAWRDPEWGLLVWLTMVTGLRRGELCGLRWRDLDLSAAVVQLERSIGQRSGRTWEKSTKTHQNRRLALDPETVGLLAEHRQRCTDRAHAIGLEIDDNAFVFSPSLDGSAHLKPDSVTQRYGRLAAQVGVKTSLHKLRHYSATELIAAGVDIRTVAGRLGHSGGGSTTLKVYTAWVSESDQRAATSLFTRLPARPETATQTVAAAPWAQPRSPYERIAAQLRDDIESGRIPAGELLPTVADLASTHTVALSTAQRAVGLLREAGLVEVARGRRSRVKRVMPSIDPSVSQLADTGKTRREAPAPPSEPQLRAVVLRGPDGVRYPARHVSVDLKQLDHLRNVLVSVARLEVPAMTDEGDSWIGEFELEVFNPDDPNSQAVRVLRWQANLPASPTLPPSA